jgi:hypothetical protein
MLKLTKLAFNFEADDDGGDAEDDEDGTTRFVIGT